jgi:hypothetical protein
MSDPNDEALHRHPLYGHGLRDLMWLGEVQDSDWLAAVTEMSASPPARHFILPLKECVIEALADGVTVERRPGSTMDAAYATLSRLS